MHDRLCHVQFGRIAEMPGIFSRAPELPSQADSLKAYPPDYDKHAPLS